MNSKEIVEKWFLKELLDNNETAEYCYKMGSTYPIQEKDKEARERYEQVKSDLEKLEKLEKVIKIYQTKRIYESVIYSTDSCYAYNSLMDYEEDKLNDEEYTLLKEVLEDEK